MNGARMYKKNDDHLQLGVFDEIRLMSKGRRRELEESWAHTFYDDVFCQIDEEIFAPLYSTVGSRPNTPVNLLVAADILKAHFCWSDEELMNQLGWNILARYALGIRNLSSNPFVIRTLYHFRRYVADYELKTGKCLWEETRKQVTEAQVAKYKISKDELREDSTLVNSNIRSFSRLQLLLTMIRRFLRLLTEEEAGEIPQEYKVYRDEDTSKLVYRVKPGEYLERLRDAGGFMAWLLGTFEVGYGQQEEFLLLRRAFREHFSVTSQPVSSSVDRNAPGDSSSGDEGQCEAVARDSIQNDNMTDDTPDMTTEGDSCEESVAAVGDELAPSIEVKPSDQVSADPESPAGSDEDSPSARDDDPVDVADDDPDMTGGVRIEPKPKDLIPSGSLLSPDDPDAVYRRKRDTVVRGYVIDAAETCVDENPCQLITHVDIAPANTDDTVLLGRHLDNISHEPPSKMNLDGGYGSAENDRRCAMLGIEFIQTAIKGAAPKGAVTLSDFIFIMDNADPTAIRCPGGQDGVVEMRGNDRVWLLFDQTCCSGCPFQKDCPASVSASGMRISTTIDKILLAIRRARTREFQEWSARTGRNPRAGAESMIYRIKRICVQGNRFPVRGKIRSRMFLIAGVMMINLLRLHKSLSGAKKASAAKGEVADEGAQKGLPEAKYAILLTLNVLFWAWREFTMLPITTHRPILAPLGARTVSPATGWGAK